MVASLLTYELGVKGIATTTIEDMPRTLLKVGLAGVAKSACPVSAAAWRLGEDFEPLLAATLDRLDAWGRLWRAWSRDERTLVSRAWAQVNVAHPTSLAWSQATRPVTATLVTLWRVRSGPRPGCATLS